MKLRWILILACVLASSPAFAKRHGKQVRYAGIHPVAKSEGGGICHIEFPHVHVYPANKLEYRLVADNYVFVGDPVAYGWDGPKYAYKGHHPIQVNVIAEVPEPDIEYCYITGPHYHYFEPPEGPDFKIVGDAYFYVGTPPQAYVEARPTYMRINAIYTPIEYTRPVIEVEPPSGWIMVRPGFVVDAPAAVVEAPRGRVVGGVGVSAGVSVHIPVPTLSVGVEVGGPAVIIKGRGHGHGHGKHKHKKWKRRH